MFKRARSDGVRAVFIVPTSYKAGYWMGLRNHAFAQMQLTEPGSDFAGVQAPLGNHTVFLVYFRGADTNSPQCGQEHRLRGLRPLLGAVEQAERARVQEQLERLAIARPSLAEVGNQAAATDEQRGPGVTSGTDSEPVRGTGVAQD